MKMNFKSERGQIMVLLVLALVGLLAFTALAIDGGMLYSDRRTAQNAADAAALAGAGAAAQYIRTYDPANPHNNPVSKEKWNCGSGAISGGGGALAVAENAAQTRAAANDFSLNFDTTGDNWVDAQCHSKYIEVRVRITTETRASLAHLVFKGSLVNTVEAVTKVDPSVPVGFGNSIIALTEKCSGNDKGIIFDGSHDTNIQNGGVWSNSCIFANGSSGNVTVTVQTEHGDEPGSIVYLDTYKPNGNITDQVSPEPTKAITTPITVEIDPPNCDGLPDRGSHNGDGNIQPGRYTSIRLNNNNTLTMDEGLYCVSKDFTVNGGLLTGVDVTIYLSGENADFSTSGAAEVHLDAPEPQCEAKLPADGGCYPALGGMLIYAQHGDVSLLGNSVSYYEGTVYAPEGEIEVGGGSSEMSNVGAQLIANTVKLHGDTLLDILYDDSLIYHNGPRVTLLE